MSQETTNFKTFNYQENGVVGFSILSTIKSTSVLDKGIYNIKTTHSYQTGLEIKLSVANKGEVFNSEIPFHFLNKVDRVFNSFYKKEIKDNVNKLGYNHKLGLLLHGKQGCGKTSVLKSYFEKSSDDYNAIVFNFTNLEYFSNTWEFIQNIRKIQSNPIVIFIDECEDLFEKYKQEEAVKKHLMVLTV